VHQRLLHRPAQVFKGRLDDLVSGLYEDELIDRVPVSPGARATAGIFVIDKYQVLEPACRGMTAVDDCRVPRRNAGARSSVFYARESGMESLIELYASGTILPCFETRPGPSSGSTTANCPANTCRDRPGALDCPAAAVPADCVMVSESGNSHREDVQRLEESGIRAVLVGEGPSCVGRPFPKLRELRGGPR